LTGLLQEEVTVTISIHSDHPLRRAGLERRQQRSGRRCKEVVAGCNDDECYRFGQFVLDQRQKKVDYNGSPIHLTKKEFLLFSVFLGSAGTVFSCHELAAQMWPDCPSHCLVTKELEVKQFIYTLRGKIDRYAAKVSWIETVRGFGYRLTDSH
jgi:DNA-binding response OmpR family regulator